MEYVNYQLESNDIPDQDFVQRGNVAIVKDAQNKFDRRVVLLNPNGNGARIALGVFWTEENAILFAEAYVKTHSPKAE